MERKFSRFAILTEIDMKQHFQNLMDEEEATIDMTPMLDVVFIMLIFLYCDRVFCERSGYRCESPRSGHSR